jgi:hypothetical protein
VTQSTGSGLSSKRQKRYKPCVFDGPLGLALAAGTVTAAFARVYLAAMRQQLLQGLGVLVIDVLFAPPAKPTLGLLRRGSPASVVLPVIFPATAKRTSTVLRRISFAETISFFEFRHISPSKNLKFFTTKTPSFFLLTFYFNLFSSCLRG